MDCVVGYYMNSLRSGVAKFNEIIAKSFNVPMFGIYDDTILLYSEPLISLKVSELSPDEAEALCARIVQLSRGRSIRLFLHTFTRSPVELEIIRHADLIYCGNAEVYAEVAAITDNVVELWSPATIMDTQPFEKTDITVFSFGMAHKIQVELYRKLRDILEQSGKSYSLVISTAFHESVSFDDSASVFEALRGTFGQHLYHMGFLSDVAVYNHVVQSTFFAAFFDQGVRANNSTVVAAMQYGAVVITNLDRYSPGSYVHMQNLIDINQCTGLPTDEPVLAAIRANARETVRPLHWDAFLRQLKGHEVTVAEERRRLRVQP